MADGAHPEASSAQASSSAIMITKYTKVARVPLDPKSRKAAEELATADRASLSEAIRRAVLEERERRLGPGSADQLRRRRALERLFELFTDHDAAAEIAELKRQDEYF